MTAIPIDRSIIPHKPGVYIFKNQHQEVLYVGKAIDLYSRISSYFTSHVAHPKTVALVIHINSVETIEVASEIEALILEANLIKKYLPLYNIRLTDDKDYLYVKITKEEFPRILTARKKELTDAKEFFGPFPSSTVLRLTLKKLRRIFPWCANPQGGRPCFFYHLGLCPGACAGKISRQDYNKIINRFSKFMHGQKEELIHSLEVEMEDYSKNLQFEQAQAIKRTIDGLNYITASNKAQVYLENPNFLEEQNRESLTDLKNKLVLQSELERIECYDISNLGGNQAVGSLVVLTNGDIDKKWYRKFKIFPGPSGKLKPNDVGMMKQVLQRRLKHKEWPLPDLILVDGGKGQVRAVHKILTELGLTIPVFGLAKRMEWLYPPYGEVIKLSRSTLSLRLLQKVRDEAHRVAINYHRKVRANSLFSHISQKTLI